VSDSTPALVMKRISDDWRPSKPGVIMWAAPERLADADGRRDDRTTRLTESNGLRESA
jgi:hypothetical protein